MPEFILNRTTNLVSKGHNIRFNKGEPTYVPPELVRDAIGLGAEPLEGDKDAMLPQDELPEEQMTQEDREALIFAAFDQIIAKNDPADFGGDGKPSLNAVKQLAAGVTIVKKEIVALFQKYREVKAAEAE